jgi:hypothetical protein
VTIPAGIQRVPNPCPRVEHPSWLQRSINERASGRKQISILSALNTMKISAEARQAATAAIIPGAGAPRMLTDGSAAGKPIKSILAEEGAAGGKPKKRVRIQLEGEVDPAAALAENVGTNAAGGCGIWVLRKVEVILAACRSIRMRLFALHHPLVPCARSCLPL